MNTKQVTVHGAVFQYSRSNGQLQKTRRWAYVMNDSLFIFPDNRQSLQLSNLPYVSSGTPIPSGGKHSVPAIPRGYETSISEQRTLPPSQTENTRSNRHNRANLEAQVYRDHNPMTSMGENRTLSMSPPPPRPPRSALGLKTIREHTTMPENEVITTKPLYEMQKKYPVTGLAKRMSISASDLLGKSRDELMLLLLQLNREKANLQRWHDYFIQQIDMVHNSMGNSPEGVRELSAIQTELDDVDGQLSLSEPLVKFLGNMLRMGDLYGGDDLMFASQYRRNLLSNHEVVPGKPSLDFARDVEAQDVARTLNASRHDKQPQSVNAVKNRSASEKSLNLASWIAQSEREISPVDRSLSSSRTLKSTNQWPESNHLRNQRAQLEAELSDLDALCAPHKNIHESLRSTQESLRHMEMVKAKDSQSVSSANAPSAALLRRLRGDPSRKRSNSIGSRAEVGVDKTFYGDENDAREEFVYPTKHNSRRSRKSVNTKREKTTSGRFTPIGSDTLTNQSQSLKRFRSIPDHLDILANDGIPPTRTRTWGADWTRSSSHLNLPDDMNGKFNPIRTGTMPTDVPFKETNTSFTSIDQHYNNLPDRSTPEIPRNTGRKYDQVPVTTDYDPFTRPFVRSDSLGALTPNAYPTATAPYNPLTDRQNRKNTPATASKPENYEMIYANPPAVSTRRNSPLLRDKDRSERVRSTYQSPHNHDPMPAVMPSVGSNSGAFTKIDSFSKKMNPQLSMNRKAESSRTEEKLERRSHSDLHNLTTKLRTYNTSGDLSMGQRIADENREQKEDTNLSNRNAGKYQITAESIESVFSPPSPVMIRERYVPSPPQREPSDLEYRHQKETRMSSIREMLIRQSLGNDSDIDGPQMLESGSPENVHRVERHSYLVDMQEKLAKEAVASVTYNAGDLI